jgi:ubiquinone/menaquinone biosynthesis C-methylase UbiE
MPVDNLKNEAELYSKSVFENTYFLGYRDLPGILSSLSQGKKALDFGCGAGRSTRFLKTLGFDTVGVDISESMLDIAQAHDCDGKYVLIDGQSIPFSDNSFDVVLSCFVFMTVSNKKMLSKIFSEISRVLKPGGIILFVTSSKYLYTKKYISYDVSPILTLESGKHIRVRLKDLGVEFDNYYYSDEDYRSLIRESGLKLEVFELPLGNPEDQIPWIDEMSFSPYMIYAAKK